MEYETSSSVWTYPVTPEDRARQERDAERNIRQRAVELAIDYYRDASVSNVKVLMDASAQIAQFIFGHDKQPG